MLDIYLFVTAITWGVAAFANRNYEDPIHSLVSNLCVGMAIYGVCLLILQCTETLI